MVHQTGQLLQADPRRADGMLLRAIIDAAGERSVIQQVAGPASVAALNALKPIAHWAPALARLGGGDGNRRKLVEAVRQDLTAVLESTASATQQVTAADSTPFADSFRYTVEHVENAARAVADGRLGQAIAAARTELESDFGDLRAMSRSARHTERSSLVEEAHEALEKAEKIRRALDSMLPHLQATARALATVERLRSATGRLDAPSAAGLKAARMSLLLVAAAVFGASLPESRHPITPRRRLPWLWLAGAAVVLAAAVVSIAVSLAGGSTTGTPNPTLSVIPAIRIPPPPTLSAVRSTLEEQQDATYYSITVHAPHDGTPVYSWHLAPPADDPGCRTFGAVYGSPNRAVWNHGRTDGCTELGPQQLGTVTVTVRTRYWECIESFFGTMTGLGVPPQPCSRI